MAIRTGEHRNGVCADSNVTPFADIMIVLLIIFMVAASVADRDDRWLRTQPGVRTSRNP